MNYQKTIETVLGVPLTIHQQTFKKNNGKTWVRTCLDLIDGRYKVSRKQLHQIVKETRIKFWKIITKKGVVVMFGSPEKDVLITLLTDIVCKPCYQKYLDSIPTEPCHSCGGTRNCPSCGEASCEVCAICRWLPYDSGECINLGTNACSVLDTTGCASCACAGCSWRPTTTSTSTTSTSTTSTSTTSTSTSTTSTSTTSTTATSTSTTSTTSTSTSTTLPPINFYELYINGKKMEIMEVEYTKIHPNADADTWSALLPSNVAVNDGDDIVIMRDEEIAFKGIVEERTPQMNAKTGVVQRIGGRHAKVRLWRKWIERNEFPDFGFWYQYYPHKIIQFYLHPSRSDIGARNRAGEGIDPSDWAITTNPAGTSDEYNVKGRDYTIGWESGANQVAGHYVRVDLGSVKSLCAIRVENRCPVEWDHDNEYPADYNIELSSDNFAADTRVVATVTGNTAHNVVHAWNEQDARYIRIRLTGAAAREWWVGEIYVYESDGDISGISEGTLTAYSEWEEELDLTYMRRTDAIQKVTDLCSTASVRWEWWVTDEGVVNFASRRGSDKSGSVTFLYSSELESTSYKQDSRQRIDKILVLGKGTGNRQDYEASSGWMGSGEYEKVVTEKELDDIAACRGRANALLTEFTDPLVTIRCEVDDVYGVVAWDVGDDVWLQDVTTGLGAAYNVTKIHRKWNTAGEQVVIEASSHKHWRGGIPDRIKKYLNDIEREKTRGLARGEVGYYDSDPYFWQQWNMRRQAFLDTFMQYDGDIWTNQKNAAAPVPTIDTVDGYPCLKMQTTALAGSHNSILTTDAEWGTERWTMVMRLKLNNVGNVLGWWGGEDSINNNWIEFYLDSTGILYAKTARAGVGTSSTPIVNHPDLMEWHTYRIERESSSLANFYIDDELVAIATTAVPTVNLNYYFYVSVVGVASNRIMYVRGCLGQQDIENR